MTTATQTEEAQSVPIVTRKGMKIKLVGFYDSLFSAGLRKMSSILKQHYDEVELFLYSPEGYGNFFKAHFMNTDDEVSSFNPALIEEMRDADVIGVSTMSNYSILTKEFINAVKEINPDCYVVWGGAHAIMNSEECFPEADAACIGEGEEAFIELLSKLDSPGKEKLDGFWFKGEDGIIKNPSRPLLVGDELTQHPFPDISSEINYVDKHTIAKLDKDVYLAKQGNNYMCVWSQGCPFRCSYCGNERFLDLTKNKYARVRYPTPEYFVGELKHILSQYGCIGFIEMIDDNFFLIKDEDILRFAELYKKEIGLPFHISGVFPGLIKDEKILDALIDAGLRRVRMGIQSGSEKTLEFFVRPTTRKAIQDTANLLMSRYPKINPPEFDIIMDIPFEEESDKKETLDLLGSFNGSFIPLIYSLRGTPGTTIRRIADENPEMGIPPMEAGFRKTRDVAYALQLYNFGVGKPSFLRKKMFKVLSKIPIVVNVALNIAILVTLGRRLYYDIKINNFATLASVFPNVVRLLYKFKVLSFYQNRLNSSVVAKSETPGLALK
jgi:anaerobic magnesium-protoporphyrin IX monomethyl ester cyclase